MHFTNNVILFALAAGFLGQECLANLTPPTRDTTTKIIYSITHDSPKIKAADMTATAVAFNALIAPLVPAGQVSSGASFWYSPTDKLYVAAAVGAGSAGHGEQNIYSICESHGIKMTGGEIGTYWKGPPAKWIAACNPSKRDCKGAIEELGIKDMFKEWNTGTSRASSPVRGKRSLPERSQKFARAQLAEELAI